MTIGKRSLRQEFERRRRALTREDVAVRGGEAQKRLAALPVFGQARLVAAYAAQPFEVPTETLIDLLAARGIVICLPRIVQGDRLLAFHGITEVLVRGPLSLMEPPASSPLIDLSTIDVWVIPGVAFTAQGDRLGRGAGYYDVTLQGARADAVKIGLTFDCLIEEALPTEEHDVPMDFVVTESTVYAR